MLNIVSAHCEVTQTMGRSLRREMGISEKPWCVSRAVAALLQHWGMPSTSHSGSDPKANFCPPATLHFGRAEPKWSRDPSFSPFRTG